MNEKLYKIKGYEDYSVTKTGKIYSHLTKKFLKFDTSCRGYCKVKLMDRRIGRFITLQVHRIVALQFIKNPRNLPEVNHKDGNKANNSVWNLEWCTAEYNKRHAVETGLYKIEEDSPRAKLTKEQVIEIYKLWENLKNKTEIAKLYNVSDALVGEILRGVRWSKTYEEYYGVKSCYKKPKRKRVTDDQIKDMLYQYYVLGLDTVKIEKNIDICNSYIGSIVKGKKYPEKVNKFLLEIKETLDNQQPNSR